MFLVAWWSVQIFYIFRTGCTVLQTSQSFLPGVHSRFLRFTWVTDDPFVLPDHLGVPWVSWIWVLISHSRFGYFGFIITLNRSLLSFLLCINSFMHILILLLVVPYIPWLSLLFSFVSFYLFDWIISNDMCLGSPSFSCMIKSAFEALSRCFYFCYLVIHSHGIVLSTGFYFFVKLIFFSSGRFCLF